MRDSTTVARPTDSLLGVVGVLAGVEVASGILQGYYTPIFTDIARHLSIADADVNWFEAAQLVVCALCIPLLARLGDLIGPKRVLLLATAVTAAGSWIMALAPGFGTFLAGSALQGAYVVWLPMEVAIVFRRTAGRPDQHRLTRRAAAVLVFALELAVIVGALTSGALVTATSMTTVLALPAIVVSACLALIWLGVEDLPGTATGGIDWAGMVSVTVVLALVMAGLFALRLTGPATVTGWLLLAAGLALTWPFVRQQRRLAAPIIDVRLLASRGQWPVQLAAAFFGMSVLGAQIPLSTFARTDPATAGYGLGVSAASVSTLIGVYVVTLAIGALALPLLTRLLGSRRALVAAAVVVAVGYGMWIVWHTSLAQALTNMAVVGLGSGCLVAALPAAAAATAPADRTGFATAMTNGTKTVGGAVASAIFAIALSATGSLDGPSLGHARLEGYLTVWTVCALASLIAACALACARPPAEEPLR